MQHTARLLAFLAVLVSIALSIYAARRITNPLQVLTQSSRAIARGDFSQRVHLKSRTEIGELAETFNVMSEELEQFVLDLRRAAEENRALFLGSIQMLAGAVDEKDPYTRGHSDRVTRYSMMIAREMGLDPAPRAKPTSTEAGVFARKGCEAAVFGPGTSTGNAHTPNERIEVAQLEKAIDAYRRIVVELCGKAGL